MFQNDVVEVIYGLNLRLYLSHILYFSYTGTLRRHANARETTKDRSMAKTREYMDYLDAHIEIAPAGSQEEYQAAEIIADIMADHGLQPAIEEFDARPFATLVPHILQILLFICLIVSGVTQGTVHYVTIGLSIICAALLLFCHFGFNLFEGLGPAQRSQNVVALSPASGDKVVKGSRPIVVVAHYDTPRESILAGPLARFQGILKRMVTPCVIATTVALIFQLIEIIPAPVRTAFWVIGIVALLPVLALAVISIIDRNLPCTEGANDNKSSVAALLSVIDEVVPSEDRVTGEGAAPRVRPRPSDTKVEAPTAPRRVTVTEEVKGVRHGKEVLLSLEILPPSCEVVYEEPKVTYVDEDAPAPQIAEPEEHIDFGEKKRADDNDLETIDFGEEKPAVAETKRQEEPVQRPAFERVVEAEPEAELEAEPERSVPRRRTVRLDEEDEFIEKDEFIEEEELLEPEPENESEPEPEPESEPVEREDERDSRRDDEYDGEEYDYEDDDPYDEDVEYDNGKFNVGAVGSWFANRFSSIRDRMKSMRENRDYEDGEDEFVEYEDDEYENEWVDAEEIEEDDRGNDRFDEEEEETDNWDFEGRYENEESEEEGDELVPLQASEVASGRPAPSNYTQDWADEGGYDEEYEQEDSTATNTAETENVTAAPSPATDEEDAFNVPVATPVAEPVVETAPAPAPVVAEEPVSEGIADSTAYDDEEYDDFEWDDQYDEYDFEDEDYDYDDEVGTTEVETQTNTVEYDDDSDEWMDWEDEYEPDDSDVVKSADAGEKPGITSRVKQLFVNEKSEAPLEDDPWEDEYEDFDFDDDWYEDYDGDEDDFTPAAEAEQPVTETVAENAPAAVEVTPVSVGNVPAAAEPAPAVEPTPVVEAAPVADPAPVVEETASATSETTPSEDDAYEAEPVENDYDEYEEYEEEELDFPTNYDASVPPADPDLLHFDREEDTDILPRDTTGLDTISDSYDLLKEEAELRKQAAPPAAIDDPNWGVSSFEPSPSMNIARRAALFDIPDPQYASVDPLSSDVEYEDDYQDNDQANEDSANENQDNEFTSNGATGWKGGATVRSDLADEDGEPIVIDADDLKDAILELGDDFLRSHDVWFVATGASASDHGGIKAFLEDHRRDIRGAFLINMECVGAGTLGMYVEEGLDSRKRADRRLTRTIKTIANDLHIKLDAVVMPWDETDAAAAMRSRVRAVSLVGLGEYDQKALSRTRDDVPDNVNPEQVSDVVRLVCEAIRRA